MVKSYEKGADIVLSKEFVSADFDCACERPECDTTLIDEVLVEGLTQLSLVYPLLIISSGHRCEKHNSEVGGAPGSFHVTGQAVDCHTPFASTQALFKEAEAIKCFAEGGMGLYSTWIHLDTRGYKARWNKMATLERK